MMFTSTTRRRVAGLVATVTLVVVPSVAVLAQADPTPPTDTPPITTAPTPEPTPTDTTPTSTAPAPEPAPTDTTPPTTTGATEAAPTTTVAPVDTLPPVDAEALDEPIVEGDPLAAADLPAALAALPSTGCTRTAPAAVDCVLFARSGTVAVDASTSLPVWVFDDSATDPVELVNPVLEMVEGDTLSIDLTNSSVPGNVSLALPAVAGAPDLVGVAAGGTTTYTFGPLDPGTYVYQAGPTPQGTRQTAMGLGGILIVRPAGYDAADPSTYTAYGDGPSTYGDELLVVTNEFDPRLNADPIGFDVSKFTPTVFTLNGQSHDGTAPIDELQQGSAVLLRAANFGLSQRRVGFTGIRSLQLAENSRRLATSSDVAALTLPPGVAADAIVRMPLDEGVTVALMDQGLSLFNGSSSAVAGQIELFELPGMGGTTGPRFTELSTTPIVTDGVCLNLEATITGVVDTSSPPTLRYFLDHLNPGDTGKVVSVVYFDGTNWVTVCGDIDPADLAALANGEHVLWLQAGEDVGGPNEKWGPLAGTSFRIDRDGPVVHSIELDPTVSNATGQMIVRGTADTTLTGGGTDVQQVKYTIDGVAPTTAEMPTVGTVIPIVGDNPARAAVEGSIDLSTLGLVDGEHTIYLFAQDSQVGSGGPGNWSQVPTPVDFLVDLGAPIVEAAVVSPTPNDGTIGHPGSQIFLDVVRLEAVITDPAITGTTSGSGIVDAEFTVGVVPEAAGTGEPMESATATWGTVDDVGNVVQLVYADIPLADLRGMPDGEIHLWVRGLDAAGNWSEAVDAVLVLDTLGPALALDPAPPTGEIVFDVADALTSVALVEWFVGSDPGVGNGNQVLLNPVGQAGYLGLSVSGLGAGEVVWLRAADELGNVSELVQATAGS